MVKRVKGVGRDTLIKTVKELSKSTVKVGFFSEQGKHSSGFTYPALMYLHEVHGIPSSDGRVYRRAFATAMQLDRKVIMADTKQKLRQTFITRTTSSSLVTKAFGESSVKSLKKVFGNPSLLPPNTPSTIKSKGGRNTPLVDTHDLVNHIKVKSSRKGDK